MLFRSHLETDCLVTFSCSASSSWDQPAFFLRFIILSARIIFFLLPAFHYGKAFLFLTFSAYNIHRLHTRYLALRFVNTENVKRVEHVRLEWVDENFQPHVQEFSGFLSRIIQHEYDHLLGEVFTDHIAPIRKQMIRNKLHNMERGKAKCAYRTVSK